MKKIKGLQGEGALLFFFFPHFPHLPQLGMDAP